MMEIRGLTIRHSAERKRDRLSKQQLLCHEIETLETEFYNDPDKIECSEVLQRKKVELEEIYSEEAKGAYIRARTKYKIDGERPTKLFCALEKYNGLQKYMYPCFKNCEK